MVAVEGSVYSERVLRRFWAKVDRPKKHLCWVWTASRDRRGYGQFMLSSNNIRKGHRMAYEIANNVLLSSDICVCHSCDNPPCVNPEHLFLGTIGDNTRDAQVKGRLTIPVHFGESMVSHKITWAQATEIRESQERSAILAQTYGVSRTTIWKIRSGKAWPQEQGYERRLV